MVKSLKASSISYYSLGTIECYRNNDKSSGIDCRGHRKFCINRIETSSLLARIGIKLFEPERKIFYENNTQGSLKELIKEEKFSNTTKVMSAIKEMFRDVLQEIMEAELEAELGYEKQERRTEDFETSPLKNYRNGYSKKTVKTQLGEVEIAVPRDRNGEYEPKIISKYSRSADGMEEKILSLYAAGLSIRGISEQIKSLYDVEISPELVSKISEKIMPQLNEWQNRPLEAAYSFIFLDAIHYKIREDHQIVTKAAYVVLGVNLDGYKEILGIWIGENESSKFWLSVLNELKSRGVQDVYLFCVDGLNGFREAIGAAYPKAGIQRCIIHQIRASMRYVNYKHAKAFTADLKEVYTAVTEEEALEKINEF
ncbi:transposase mutator type [Lucifera butyrica]|uniref:Mutator family transposase n=1 Tax=Lucifera butyrica TaxID=1351585 RepID=A0A498R6K0_9FIRM|nr:transposase mutator type [Lucifera butyrica]